MLEVTFEPPEGPLLFAEFELDGEELDAFGALVEVEGAELDPLLEGAEAPPPAAADPLLELLAGPTRSGHNR